MEAVTTADATAAEAAVAAGTGVAAAVVVAAADQGGSIDKSLDLTGRGLQAALFLRRPNGSAPGPALAVHGKR